MTEEFISRPQTEPSVAHNHCRPPSFPPTTPWDAPEWPHHGTQGGAGRGATEPNDSHTLLTSLTTQHYQRCCHDERYLWWLRHTRSVMRVGLGSWGRELKVLGLAACPALYVSSIPWAAQHIVWLRIYQCHCHCWLSYLFSVHAEQFQADKRELFLLWVL